MTAVVISTYGRAELTKRTLDTLFKSDLGNNKVTVTVVDNGSQTSMVTMLVGYRDRIDNLVLLRENRGKPYALNLGARVAQERCGAMKLQPPTHFLFCDNDLDFKPDWHDKLVAAYEEHKGLPLCALSGMRWPSHKLDRLQRGTTQVNVVRFPPGCCVLMSVEAFRVCGPWDTNRLIRTVDTRYFRNAQNRGYSNASIHPDTLINHTGRTSRTWHLKTGKPKLLP